MVFAESYSHVQKQEQRVTASMIQGLNMLSLPAQAMYDYLVELSMANPMLDIPVRKEGAPTGALVSKLNN